MRVVEWSMSFVEALSFLINQVKYPTFKSNLIIHVEKRSSLVFSVGYIRCYVRASTTGSDSDRHLIKGFVFHQTGFQKNMYVLFQSQIIHVIILTLYSLSAGIENIQIFFLNVVLLQILQISVFFFSSPRGAHNIK